MTRAHRHRASPRLPLWAVVVPVLVGVLFFAAGLMVRVAEPVAAATPGRTVTVTHVEPGPTTTISYLIEVTVTPGRNGY